MTGKTSNDDRVMDNVREYLKHGKPCPFCGSFSIDSVGPIGGSSYELGSCEDGNGFYARQDYMCSHCGEKWIDLYRAYGINHQDINIIPPESDRMPNSQIASIITQYTRKFDEAKPSKNKSDDRWYAGLLVVNMLRELGYPVCAEKFAEAAGLDIGGAT